jgi:glycosyltransferase involved in cell wall biosynthesis
LAAKALAKASGHIDRLPLRLYPGHQPAWHPAWLRRKTPPKKLLREAHIVNLHWIVEGFVAVKDLAALEHRPVVWTLHDMWPFTGGCHYAQQCQKFTQLCGACPQLGSARQRDLSRWVFKRKRRIYRSLSLHVVCPSRWLAQQVGQSALLGSFPVRVIPNGLDTSVFKPIDKAVAREALNLPQGKRLLLFGAHDVKEERKGFSYLKEALSHLKARPMDREGLLLLLFGAGREDSTSLPFEAHHVGMLSDEVSLALLYSAADVYITPSLQDNLPNTVMEALACGTPVVAFASGGIPEMFAHQEEGYLAQSGDSQDLARGILWVLNHPRYQELADKARDRAQRHYSQETQARRYRELYQELVG